MLTEVVVLQVYKGTLKTGETVAVKVQRPYVLETVTIDLFIIRSAFRIKYLSHWLQIWVGQDSDYLFIGRTRHCFGDGPSKDSK